MKIYSSLTESYRAAGKAHCQVNLLSFRVKEFANPANTAWFHFGSTEDDITTTVPDTGTGPTSRTFLGGGHIVAMDPIIRSEGAKVRTMNWTLSGASPSVLNMVNGYNCREAVAQYFVGEVDQDTGLFVDTPAIEFLGSIDTIDLAEGALGVADNEPAASEYVVSVVSIGAALLRINADMRSPEVSAQRSGDAIFKHAGSAQTWTRLWGKDGKSKRDRDGGEPKGPVDPRNPYH